MWSVEHMERSLHTLGLVAFNLCVNLIFLAVLFINKLHMHVLIQIGKVSLRNRKTGLYEVFFAFVDLYL